MDFVRERGEFLFGTRMRRLTERIMQDVSQIYKAEKVDFESRHCAILLVLHTFQRATSSEIASTLGITSPAVSQLTSEMIKLGLVQDHNCTQDKRKRWLSLTDKGKAMLDRLRPMCILVEQAVKELLAETDYPVMAVIASIEDAMERKSLDKRYAEIKRQALAEGRDLSHCPSPLDLRQPVAQS